MGNFRFWDAIGRVVIILFYNLFFIIFKIIININFYFNCVSTIYVI